MESTFARASQVILGKQLILARVNNRNHSQGYAVPTAAALLLFSMHGHSGMCSAV
jgi:hypothetical protein